MTTVATIGFDHLRRAMVMARSGAAHDAAVAAVAGAYLTFASENQALYLVMFTENHLAIRYDEAFAKGSEEAFLVLEEAVRLRLARKGRQRARLIATAIWAALHGTTILSFGGLLQPKISPPEQVQSGTNQTIIEMLIEGLVS